MTELEIASAIKNYVTSQKGVTSFELTIRQIRDEVDSFRLRLIEEMGRARVLPPEAYYQDLTPDEDTTVEKTGPFKGWSYIKCPRIYMNVRGKPQISYAGPIGESLPYRVLVGNQHIYVKSERFTGEYPIALYTGGRLYFSDAPDRVTVVAIYEDPSDLEAYGYDYESAEYPAPGSDQDKIIGKTVESYLRTMYRLPYQPNTQIDTPQINQK